MSFSYSSTEIISQIIQSQQKSMIISMDPAFKYNFAVEDNKKINIMIVSS